MLQRKRGSVWTPFLPLLAVVIMLIVASCCCCTGGDDGSDFIGSVEKILNNCTWENSAFGYVCVPNKR